MQWEIAVVHICTIVLDLIEVEHLLDKNNPSQTIYLMDMYSCRSKLFA